MMSPVCMHRRQSDSKSLEQHGRAMSLQPHKSALSCRVCHLQGSCLGLGEPELAGALDEGGVQLLAARAQRLLQQRLPIEVQAVERVQAHLCSVGLNLGSGSVLGLG